MVAVFATGTALAIDVEADLGIYSHYIWRGMNLDNRPVVQGGLTVSSTNGFYANVWANYATEEGFVGEDYDRLNEVDYTLGYAGTWKVLDYDVGYIHYSFPDTDWEATQELYVGLALNNLVVTPSVYVYYDFQDVDGFYILADLNYGKDLSDNLSMEVGASAGVGDSDYNEHWYGKDRAAVSDVNIYTGLSYAFNEHVSLNGGLTYTMYPDGSMSSAASDNYVYDDNLWGGVSLTLSY